jgi:hypothetical protein
METEAPVPNPGSDAALKAGCTCPVLDNCHGKGFSWGSGDGPKFWISGGCPLHCGKRNGTD